MSVQFDAVEPHINYFLFWRLIMVRLVRKESEQRITEMTQWVGNKDKFTQNFAKVVASFPYYALFVLGMNSTPLINTFYRKIKDKNNKGYFVLSSTIPEFITVQSNVSNSDYGLTEALDDMCFSVTKILRDLTTVIYEKETKSKEYLMYDYSFDVSFIPKIFIDGNESDDILNKVSIYKFGFNANKQEVYAESPFNKSSLTNLNSKRAFADYFDSVERGNSFSNNK